ncbi:MAG: formate dehydrogenase [Herpetosiphon sp.]
MPGLGITWGRGGATTAQQDLQNADAIMMMGSNFAECHPVGFRWAMKAKAKGAKLIHVDPRFTRTSAMADIHAPIRAGSDIVFLGGIINYLIQNEKYFKEFVVAYTNGPTLIDPAYKDTEDLDGFFSGWDDKGKKYSPDTWKYQTTQTTNGQNQPQPAVDESQSFSARVGKLVGGRPKQDLTMQDPQCVFQIIKRHYSRYTPEMVEQMTGCPKEQFLKVAETLAQNSGRERTSTIVYAVGWTQHTVGVQIIRCATVLQSLLGNIGRPGGGILALRGHATIQGSTDVPTLYNLLPGYLNAPSVLKKHDTLGDYLETEAVPTAYWANMPKFMVSLLKAWYGDAATKDNGYMYDFQPKIVGDHSHMPMFVAMAEGSIKGFFAIGQNPAVGGQNSGFQRRALAKLDWMVVRDLFETETATFWKDSPEFKGKSADVKTEVFFLPAAAVTEGEGTFTNTQRLVQRHDKAVDPPGDARTDLWFSYHLFRRLQELYHDSTNPHDAGIKALTWSYVDEEENKKWKIKDEPSSNLVMREINGYTVADKKVVKGFGDLKDDGTTACGVWIYSGINAPTPEAPEGFNRAAARKPGQIISPGWGFAWPANRHIMYNRASADPDGKPWSERKKLVYWDANAEATNVAGQATKGKWVGVEGEVPDFILTKAPNTPGKDGGVGLDFHSGADPFIMKGDGKAWLFAPSGLADGPLPTHYEPYESPVQSALYKQSQNPATKIYNVEGNKYAAPGDPNYPIILSTYRLTEHHLSGSMSRWVPWLAELQPELFVEISPELAKEKGITNTSMVKVSTPRATILAKALVTKRMRPFKIGDKVIHQVGMPWHWGYKGIAQGAVVNDLSAMVGDPNVNIHEAKVFVCNVEKA